MGFRKFCKTRLWTIIFALFVVCLSTYPDAAQTGIGFSSGKSALKIPFELHNNQIYLQVAIKDSKPMWFILDTGASNILSRSTAQKLGLKIQERGEFQSPGKSGVLKYALTNKNVSFKLPGAVFTDDAVLVVAFEDLEKCLGHTADGIVGWEVFESAVIEVDYKNRLINIYEPGSYGYAGKGESFPLETLSNRLVAVRTNFIPAPGRASVSGKFVVDTGFAFSLLLNSDFVAKNKLLAPGQGQAYPVCGFGTAKAIKDRVASIWLGTDRFENPTTIFSEPQQGVTEHEGVDGLLGGEFLGRFKVIFDYSRGRMILETYSQ